MNCPHCNERQWSVFDNIYLELFDTCWSCDNKKCMNGSLSLEEFEKKELQASRKGEPASLDGEMNGEEDFYPDDEEYED